jgi:hypothetical protein
METFLSKLYVPLEQPLDKPGGTELLCNFPNQALCRINVKSLSRENSQAISITRELILLQVKQVILKPEALDRGLQT